MMLLLRSEEGITREIQEHRVSPCANNPRTSNVFTTKVSPKSRDWQGTFGRTRSHVSRPAGSFDFMFPSSQNAPRLEVKH